MERGIVYKLFAILVFLVSSSIIAQNGTFEFTTAVVNSGVVTETVSTITVTVSQQNQNLSLLDLSGLRGTSGNFVLSSTVADQITIEFSDVVDITYIHVGSGPNLTNYYWTFTSDQSDSKNIGINNINGVDAYLGFAGIKFIYINHENPSQGTGDQFVIDNITMLEGLPVELIEFTAVSGNSSIELKWQTATEVNNYGFEVQRREIFENDLKSEWELLGFVPGHGNSNSPKSYEFIDENPPKGNLEYRLKQIDTDGSYELYGTTAGINNSVTAVNDESQPDKFSLSQNYPNPFNPTTTIEYSIPVVTGRDLSLQSVRLSVYDILGKEVATLVNTSMQPGKYTAGFNGCDLPSGMYFYNLSVNGSAITRKMTLIK